MMDKVDIIPEWKVREACAKCTKDAKYARFFKEAPSGAQQYIALVFFETVYPDDLTEEVSDQCFKNVLQELDADDLRYLIAHETDQRTRDEFIQRLAYLREEPVLKRMQAEMPTSEAGYGKSPAPRSAERAAPPVYKFVYNARRLDREVSAWNRRWVMVCVYLTLIVLSAIIFALGWFAISRGWVRIRRW